MCTVSHWLPLLLIQHAQSATDEPWLVPAVLETLQRLQPVVCYRGSVMAQRHRMDECQLGVSRPLDTHGNQATTVWIHVEQTTYSKKPISSSHTFTHSLTQLHSNSMMSSYCFCLALHKYNRQEQSYNSTESPVWGPGRNKLLFTTEYQSVGRYLCELSALFVLSY